MAEIIAPSVEELFYFPEFNLTNPQNPQSNFPFGHEGG